MLTTSEYQKAMRAIRSANRRIGAVKWADDFLEIPNVHVYNALNHGYISPTMEKALRLWGYLEPLPIRTRFTADVTPERLARIDADIKAMGYKSRREFLDAWADGEIWINKYIDYPF